MPRKTYAVCSKKLVNGLKLRRSERINICNFNSAHISDRHSHSSSATGMINITWEHKSTERRKQSHAWPGQVVASCTLRFHCTFVNNIFQDFSHFYKPTARTCHKVIIFVNEIRQTR